MPDETIVNPDTPNETVPETVDTPETPITPEPIAPEVDVLKLQETNKKLFERAKTAEEKLKAFKAKPPEAQSAPSQVDVDERILKVNGMPDELLKQLKRVAALGGVSLVDAQTDPLFVAVKDTFDKEQKQKAASLPASRGSGSGTAPKNFTSPNLSREEHMAMIKNL